VSESLAWDQCRIEEHGDMTGLCGEGMESTLAALLLFFFFLFSDAPFSSSCLFLFFSAEKGDAGKGSARQRIGCFDLSDCS
jgi:hypothetical protein